MTYDPMKVKEYRAQQRYDEAVSYCAEYVKQGSAEAANDLALLYYGNDALNNEFFKLAQSAYGQHVPGSAVTYGLAFLEGRGTITSPTMAERLFREAAEAGDALGCFYYARCLTAKKEFDSAADYYVKSCELGCAAGKKELIDRYTSDKGTLWRTRAASFGSVQAKFDTALLLEKSAATPEEMQKVTEIYEECAKNGFTEAVYRLGSIYESQHRTTDALRCYETAGEKGHTQAQNRALTLRAAIAKAQGILELAQTGDAKAQYQYAQCLEEGKGIQADMKAAVEWYTKSAEGGNVKAQYRMGQLCEEGMYMPLDMQKAIDWYMRAANTDKPYSVAFFRLYQIYSDGIGTEQDFDRAREYLISSANYGYTVAALLLAGYYEHGEGGFEFDMAEAAKYYLKAAECNNNEAKKHIQDMLTRANAGYGDALYFAWAYTVCKERNPNSEKALDYLSRSAYAGYTPAMEATGIKSAGNHEPVIPELTAETSAYLTEDEARRVEELYPHAEGNADAAYELGCIYKAAAQRTDANEDLWYMASQFFGTGAKGNHAQAQYEYANCLSAGRGVVQNPAEAFRMYTIAYNNNEIRALTSMGIYYLRGKAPELDKTKALECFERAAEAGDPEAQYRLAKYYASHGIEEKTQYAFETCMKAAEAGHAKAQLFVGSCYETGKGVEQNMNKALEWYTLAAEQGLTAADYAIAVCYEKGKGVEKDERHAFELYLSAAQRDNISAQFRVACMYEHGMGTEESAGDAFYWYSVSADRGNYKSLHALGNCYEFGIGCKKDMDKAVDYYIQASEHGNSWSQYRMCEYYSSGIYTEPNYDEALKYCKMAADNKSAFAQYCLGRWYEKGTVVEQDMRKAVSYYRMSADQGNPAALCALGVCSEEGNGVTKNITEAIMLYGKSAHMNYAPALYRLGLCCETGYGTELDVSEAIAYYEKAAALGYAPAIEKMTALLV